MWQTRFLRAPKTAARNHFQTVFRGRSEARSLSDIRNFGCNCRFLPAPLCRSRLCQPRTLARLEKVRVQCRNKSYDQRTANLQVHWSGLHRCYVLLLDTVCACSFRGTSARLQNRQFRFKNLMSDRLLARPNKYPVRSAAAANTQVRRPAPETIRGLLELNLFLRRCRAVSMKGLSRPQLKHRTGMRPLSLPDHAARGLATSGRGPGIDTI